VHHLPDPSRVANIGQRIRVEQNQIRNLSLGYGAERIQRAEKLGRIVRRRRRALESGQLLRRAAPAPHRGVDVNPA